MLLTWYVVCVLDVEFYKLVFPLYRPALMKGFFSKRSFLKASLNLERPCTLESQIAKIGSIRVLIRQFCS